MNAHKRRKIKKVIEATWSNPEGKELRDKLFPNGKPEPEEFIQVMAQLINERRVSK